MYETLAKKPNANPIYYTCMALCLFHMGMFAESEEAALKNTSGVEYHLNYFFTFSNFNSRRKPSSQQTHDAHCSKTI